METQDICNLYLEAKIHWNYYTMLLMLMRREHQGSLQQPTTHKTSLPICSLWPPGSIFLFRAPPQPWKQFLINKIFLGKTKWFKGKPWPVCYANESVPSLPRNITNISKYDKMIYWQCCRTRDGVAGHRDATLSSDQGSTGSKHLCVILLNDAFSRWKGPLRTIESSLSLEVGL